MAITPMFLGSVRVGSRLGMASALLPKQRSVPMVCQVRNHGPGGCGAECGAGEIPQDRSIWDKSDIAFKPNTSGWGFNNKYSSGWDKIFNNGAAKKDKAHERSEADAPKEATQ